MVQNAVIKFEQQIKAEVLKMINTKLLDSYINNIGLNYETVANMLGISADVLIKKCNNIIDFKSSEIYSLCMILSIKEDANAIFFG